MEEKEQELTVETEVKEKKEENTNVETQTANNNTQSLNNNTQNIGKKSQTKLIIGIIVAVIVIVFVAAIAILNPTKIGDTIQTGGSNPKTKEEVVDIQQTTSIGEKAEITIIGNKVVQKIEPTTPSGYYTYFEAKDGKKYIDVMANVKNLSEMAVKQNSLFTAKAYIDDLEYECSLMTEKDNGTNLNGYTSSQEINALETIKYHIATQVPEEVIQAGKTVKFILTSDEKNYVYEVKLIENSEEEQNQNSSTINLTAKEKEIKAKEKLTVEDVCEFTIVKSNIVSKVVPPSAAGYYTYYKADDGKVYFDLTADIKNLKSEAVRQDAVIGNVTLIYDEKYEYDCLFAVEEDNGEDLNGYTNLYDINPLETMRYHIMVQVPKEVKSSSKKMDVKINIKGEEYVYHAR